MANEAMVGYLASKYDLQTLSDVKSNLDLLIENIAFSDNVNKGDRTFKKLINKQSILERSILKAIFKEDVKQKLKDKTKDELIEIFSQSIDDLYNIDDRKLYVVEDNKLALSAEHKNMITSFIAYELAALKQA